MACTYDVTTDRGKVRWTVGDTSTTACIIADDEIDMALTTNSNNINLASADVLEAMMAKYTLSPESERIGDYSYTNNIITKMNKLRNELREKDATSPYQTWAEPDLTAGSGITSEDD